MGLRRVQKEEATTVAMDDESSWSQLDYTEYSSAWDMLSTSSSSRGSHGSSSATSETMRLDHDIFNTDAVPKNAVTAVNPKWIKLRELQGALQYGARRHGGFHRGGLAAASGGFRISRAKKMQ